MRYALHVQSLSSIARSQLYSTCHELVLSLFEMHLPQTFPLHHETRHTLSPSIFISPKPSHRSTMNFFIPLHADMYITTLDQINNNHFQSRCISNYVESRSQKSAFPSSALPTCISLNALDQLVTKQDLQTYKSLIYPSHIYHSINPLCLNQYPTPAIYHLCNLYISNPFP